NQITYNPGMSAMALFCCTDTGVYINYDYVGIDEAISEPSTMFIAWPNPASNEINISHDMEGDLTLSIYTADGKMIDHIQHSNPEKELKYNCSMMKQGIYFIQLDNGMERHSLKWIKK
ncbi:MAG: T9SS type A sorting domain-containing protein, partial [Bacteroidales bacterium]|nr:T9SS type A sorting domain-containing protein [Bacteroidales bacterium]